MLDLWCGQWYPREVKSILKVHRWGAVGVPVVALHCSGLSGLQWRRIGEAAGSHHQILAPDFLGYGGSPASPNGLNFRYSEDVEQVVALIDELRTPCLMLGHSYGGFIALKAALERPEQILGLCLYEPVMWGGLASFSGVPIEDVVRRFDPDLLLLNKSQAGTETYLHTFIDYWNGEGAWASMTDLQKKPVLNGAEKIAAEVYEVVTDTTPHTDYRQIDCPIHILHGTISPPEVLAMKDILVQTIPHLSTACIPGGHMNPIRNPIPVNAHFELFLKKYREGRLS
jgi:pimeloyl-ACP methyl ester carboxylesterase